MKGKIVTTLPCSRSWFNDCDRNSDSIRQHCSG